MRQITIDYQVYNYEVGLTYTGIHGVGYVLNSELIGVTPWTYEKGQHKGTSDGMVAPSMIERYIRWKVNLAMELL